MNNKSNKNILLGFIFIIIIIIFVLIFISYFNKNENKKKEVYNVLMPLQGNAQNMNICPKGCVRGNCNRKNGDCKYDFQCQYCSDAKTNNFYVDFNDERKIIPLYEEEDKLTINQKNKLNEEIEKNNEYIELLNKKIMMMNN